MEQSSDAQAREAPCLLAGDIGGTKTNLGLFSNDPSGPKLIVEKTYVSNRANGLEEMIEDLLDKASVPIGAACFGIAGPVIEGLARLTNLNWGVSETKLRQRFACERIELINDLTATALAIPWLTRGQLTSLNENAVANKGNIALVAPGTGLGQALLLRHHEDYLPVASEGGHADFAPTNETEADLWRNLHQRHGRISIERVLSGTGLVNIYLWLAQNRAKETSTAVRRALENRSASDPARIISQEALEGRNVLCREALMHYCRILGAVAGNLALTAMATGGVFLGGGIPPKILPVLEKSDFMKSFCAKGRFADLMTTIPVWVIRNDKAALLGAAHRAQMLFKQP